MVSLCTLVTLFCSDRTHLLCVKLSKIRTKDCFTEHCTKYLIWSESYYITKLSPTYNSHTVGNFKHFLLPLQIGKHLYPSACDNFTSQQCSQQQGECKTFYFFIIANEVLPQFLSFLFCFCRKFRPFIKWPIRYQASPQRFQFFGPKFCRNSITFICMKHIHRYNIVEGCSHKCPSTLTSLISVQSLITCRQEEFPK